MTPSAPFHILLHQPEIPPNTGNVMRLCAAAGAVLHLIGPLGFRLDAAAVRRAGMDYRELAQVCRHDDWESYLHQQPEDTRLFALSTKGILRYDQPRFQPGDRFLFGSEGSGLPADLLARYAERTLRLPMLPERRSLNLANSVSILLYEALRQTGFPDLT